ncbi:hypothetical protein MHBO_000302 [Bonamia ostreae]|uniref:Uncharacterized protein n=1 Tax=Bonamia ostreae TaxID=126728 RepID=A0ABV2AF47_9EUKA
MHSDNYKYMDNKMYLGNYPGMQPRVAPINTNMTPRHPFSHPLDNEQFALYSPRETTTPKTIKAKKQRKRVAIACVPCNKAKTSCDGGFLVIQ